MNRVQNGTAEAFGKDRNRLAPICQVHIKHDPI